MGYMTAEQVKHYVRTWLIWVGKMPMAQPVFHVKQRSLLRLPKPEPKEREP